MKEPEEEKKSIELKEFKINIPESPRACSSPKNENLWKIGCLGNLDKRCIVYFSQLILLSTCIGVSLYEVSTKSENRDFWIGLLSSSIGVLIPSPKLKK